MFDSTKQKQLMMMTTFFFEEEEEEIRPHSSSPFFQAKEPTTTGASTSEKWPPRSTLTRCMWWELGFDNNLVDVVKGLVAVKVDQIIASISLIQMPLSLVFDSSVYFYLYPSRI